MKVEVSPVRVAVRLEFLIIDHCLLQAILLRSFVFVFNVIVSSVLYIFSFPSTATASYRLLPEITILKPCTDELAEKLVKCFSKGVIKIEEAGGRLSDV